jgi:hypothetical protein
MLKKEFTVKENEWNSLKLGYFNEDRIVLNSTVQWTDVKGGKRPESKNISLNIQEIEKLYLVLGGVLDYHKGIEQYRRATFSIEGESYIQVGYTKDNRWNGWECPSFEYKEARAIMDEWNENEVMKAWYEEETDSFYFFDGYAYSTIEDACEDDAIEEVTGRFITVQGELVKVYSIGDGWIWSEHREFTEDEEE